MGNSILKGISAALFISVITLLAGMVWTALGFGGLTMSTLVDIGLIASCVTAGYRTGRESGQWILGGFAGIGYVILCVTILALFLEVSGWGVIQVLAEGGLIGILAGAFGAGSGHQKSRPAGSWGSARRFSSWGDSSGWNSYSERTYDEKDSHVDDWEEWDERDIGSKRDTPGMVKRENSWEDWKRDSGSTPKVKGQDNPLDEMNTKNSLEEDEWESWLQGEKGKTQALSSSSSHRKAWWEEDVL